jgi:SAM domain (Sterile alpha motif)
VVSTITEWLALYATSEYSERFVDERIEIDVLYELTDQDLERLGIPLGHRRRMLRAIRELGTPTTPQGAGRGSRQRCYALQDRDTIYFTSFQATRAPPVRSASVGAERSMVAPANECLSKVPFFGDRSSHRMTTSHTERNHQEKSTISLSRQIADTRCEEAARSRERRGELQRSYQQDAA